MGWMLCKLKMTNVYFQGTDVTMLNKLHQNHGKNQNYLKPKAAINKNFGLNHFAGVVFYDSNGQHQGFV